MCNRKYEKHAIANEQRQVIVRTHTHTVSIQIRWKHGNIHVVVLYLICVDHDLRRYMPSDLVITNRIWYFQLYYNYYMYMYLWHAGLPFIFSTLMLLHFSTLANWGEPEQAPHWSNSVPAMFICRYVGMYICIVRHSVNGPRVLIHWTALILQCVISSINSIMFK